MKRATVVGIGALCAALAAGCGGRDERESPDLGQEDARPRLVSAVGCLTSEGDRYVLTALQPGAAGAGVAERKESLPDPAADNQPTTETYQLVGDDDALRELVGRQVRVTGEAPPPEVAEVRELTPPAPPAGTPDGQGTAGREAPRVATATEARLEVTRLTVRSVADAGEACPAGAASGEPSRR